jgi:transposase
MKKVFIGIDVSKDWIDYAVRRADLQNSEPAKKVNNDLDSITKLCQNLLKRYGQQNLHVVFEHTGNFGLLLSCILESFTISYTVVPALEIKLSLGITRGKSDVVDAGRIAEYGAINEHKLKQTKLPSEVLMQIKELLTYRLQLVKISVQFKNSLKAHKIASSVSHLNNIVKDIEQKIEGYKEDIERIERQIKELIDQEPELKKNFGYITSVKGIGLMIAAYMIVATNNFTSFDNPRKFNCYSGIAPFEHTSGSSIRGKTQTSNLANKTIKTLLYSGAMSAANHDPQLKKYYDRKRAEGKEHQTVINAIACKLTSRAFATVKRQSNFVVLAI